METEVAEIGRTERRARSSSAEGRDSPKKGSNPTLSANDIDIIDVFSTFPKIPYLVPYS